MWTKFVEEFSILKASIYVSDKQINLPMKKDDLLYLMDSVSDTLVGCKWHS